MLLRLLLPHPVLIEAVRAINACWSTDPPQPPESVDEVPPGKLGGKAAVALLKRSPSALPAWLDDPLPTLSLPLPGGAVRPPKAPIAPPPERRQVQRQELPHAPVSTAGAQQEQQAPAAGGVELDWLLPDVAHASGALQSPSIKLGEQEVRERHGARRGGGWGACWCVGG